MLQAPVVLHRLQQIDRRHWCPVGSLAVGQFLLPLGCDEVALLHRLKTLPAGVRLGTGAGQEHQPGFLQQPAGQVDRLAHAADASHRTTAAIPRHDRRITLHAAVGIEHGPVAGVEPGDVLEGGDTGTDSLNGRSTGVQHSPALGETAEQLCLQGVGEVGGEALLGQHAGPPMECQGRSMAHGRKDHSSQPMRQPRSVQQR